MKAVYIFFSFYKYSTSLKIKNSSAFASKTRIVFLVISFILLKLLPECNIMHIQLSSSIFYSVHRYGLPKILLLLYTVLLSHAVATSFIEITIRWTGTSFAIFTHQFKESAFTRSCFYVVYYQLSPATLGRTF